MILAGLELSRGSWPTRLVRASDRSIGWIFPLLDWIHPGRTGDYVAWLVGGLLFFGVVLAI